MQKRLEALRRDIPSDVDVSIDPAVSRRQLNQTINRCVACLKGAVHLRTPCAKLSCPCALSL